MNNLDNGMDFSVIGKIAVITGGSGVLCGAMSRALARKGARVAVLGRNVDKAQQIVDEIIQAGGQSIALGCDVTSLESLENAARVVEDRLGPAEILINGAGGNSPLANTDQDTIFFDLPPEALQQVVDLNLLGTFFSCQIFGRQWQPCRRGSF